MAPIRILTKVETAREPENPSWPLVLRPDPKRTSVQPLRPHRIVWSAPRETAMGSVESQSGMRSADASDDKVEMRSSCERSVTAERQPEEAERERNETPASEEKE
jgi:hypothetical protein